MSFFGRRGHETIFYGKETRFNLTTWNEGFYSITFDTARFFFEIK
jgi:hypothetical protein